MPRFAANLTMMFTEWPFLDRFAAAREAGFDAVEFLFPYDHAPHEVGDRLHAQGLTQALFNLPPATGRPGNAAMPPSRIGSTSCSATSSGRSPMSRRPASPGCI